MAGDIVGETILGLVVLTATVSVIYAFVSTPVQMTVTVALLFATFSVSYIVGTTTRRVLS